MRAMAAIMAGLFVFGATSFSPRSAAEENSPGESEKEKKEKEEMVKDLIGHEGDQYFGTLALEPLVDGQPAPKFAGTLTTKTEVYKIKLQFPEQRSSLVEFDKKEVHIAGHLIDKGDQGKVLYFDEVVGVTSGRSPERKKRGGF
jgi:hypothetical protein